MIAATKNWLLAKVVMMLGSAFLAALSNYAMHWTRTAVADPTAYVPAAVLPVLVIPGVLWAFLRMHDDSYAYYTWRRIWNAGPLYGRSAGHVPSYHLIGCCFAVGGAASLTHALLFMHVEPPVDLSTAIFGLSTGTGMLMGVALMRRSARRAYLLRADLPS